MFRTEKCPSWLPIQSIIGRKTGSKSNQLKSNQAWLNPRGRVSESMSGELSLRNAPSLTLDQNFPKHNQAANMDDSDSSSLSSAPPTDDEKLAPIFKMARGKKATPKRKKKAAGPPPTPPSPPRPKRTPSPEHEVVLADNSDIAVGQAITRRVEN